MSYEEPEGLYPEYREEFTKKLVALMKTGESMRVSAPSGTGKSKYFRYISSSKTIHTRFFEPENIQLLYVDLNKAIEGTMEQLLSVLAEVLKTAPVARDIEHAIAEQLRTYKKIYLVVDQAELLNEADEAVIRYIRAIRDQYKYQFGFIFSFEGGISLDVTHLRYIFSIAPIEVKFPLLSEADTARAIDDIAERFGITVSPEEKEKVIRAATGYGRRAKIVVSKMAAGMTCDEAIAALREEAPSVDAASPKNIPPESSSEDHDILSHAQKAFTKNEYLFFHELFAHQGSIVTRDTFADLLSPLSDGEGVSNEAIDQVVSRLRKAIEREKFPYSIENKHGVGYYLTRN